MSRARPKWQIKNVWNSFVLSSSTIIQSFFPIFGLYFFRADSYYSFLFRQWMFLLRIYWKLNAPNETKPNRTIWWNDKTFDVIENVNDNGQNQPQNSNDDLCRKVSLSLSSSLSISVLAFCIWIFEYCTLDNVSSVQSEFLSTRTQIEIKFLVTFHTYIKFIAVFN